jgi:hypothetical protein
MSEPLEKLQARLREVEDQIEAEWEKRRSALNYRVERGRVIFSDGAKEAHRHAKVRLWRFLGRTQLLVILTAPFIYACVIPFALLDLFVTIYQMVCFPVYKIAKVKRSDYIVIDRQHLAYLNGIQKLNCVYCGYGNGVAAYVREVSARTEKYWCPIKHAKRSKGAHHYYGEFVDYGDAEGFVEKSPLLRKDLND